LKALFLIFINETVVYNIGHYKQIIHVILSFAFSQHDSFVPSKSALFVASNLCTSLSVCIVILKFDFTFLLTMVDLQDFEVSWRSMHSSVYLLQGFVSQ
jgi:hypothetical protein